MKNTVKAFATNPFLGKEVPALSTNSRIFMANAVNFNLEDKDFGRTFKNDYGYCTPEYATVLGFTPNKELTEFAIMAILTDAHGTPLTNTEKDVVEFTIRANDQFGLSIWSDSEEAVKALCERENEENIHGLQKIIEMANNKIAFIQSSSNITRQEVGMPCEAAKSAVGMMGTNDEVKTHPMFQDQEETNKESAKSEFINDMNKED